MIDQKNYEQNYVLKSADESTTVHDVSRKTFCQRGG
jgi:hypothetical protein